MHQTDVGVERHRHRLFGDLTVAVRNGYRMLFVQADHHLRILVAKVVDDAVVKAAIAGAGHERDVFEIEPPGNFGDDVAAPVHFRFPKVLRPVNI